MRDLFNIDLDEIACIEFKANLLLPDFFIITLKSGRQSKVSVEQGIIISAEYNKRKTNSRRK